MGFTSDSCWFLLIKTLLIKNNKKREAALKNEAGGDEKHFFFLLGLMSYVLFSVLVRHLSTLLHLVMPCVTAMSNTIHQFVPRKIN